MSARILIAFTLLLASLYPRAALAIIDCSAPPDSNFKYGPTGCDVQFGMAKVYDQGTQPAVAINPSNLAIEVHKSQNSSALWYRVGELNGINISWGNSHKLEHNGFYPAVALTSDGHVLVVWGSQATRNGSDLWYSVGNLDAKAGIDQTINWDVDNQKWDGGYKPSISINSHGVIVGVHESNNGSNHFLYYRIGSWSNHDYHISWLSGPDGVNYATGTDPSISVNDMGQVLETHQDPNSSNFHYIRGSLTVDKLNFGTDQPRITNFGYAGSVALMDNGLAIATYYNAGIYRVIGRLSSLNSNNVDWSPPVLQGVRVGGRTKLSVSGNTAAYTYEGVKNNLYYSVSLIDDRNNWMKDMLANTSIGERTLGEIVIPGTHDAGMYENYDFSIVDTLAQDQNLYQQLQGGVRYFDLRVQSGSPQRFYHGPTNSYRGPSVNQGLDDVAKFMREEGGQRKEVVILKFSHFRDFNACPSSDYNTLKENIVNKLGPWLYKDSSHPFQASLNSIVGTGVGGGKVIVVVDKKYAVDDSKSKCSMPAEGIYVYRDWEASEEEAAEGRATVFDDYANVTSYNTMKKDQLKKFADYNGRMKNKSNLPCDLFLMSWTLTPIMDINSYVEVPNQNLASEMSNVNRNGYDKIPNILFVDYYEGARVTDTAITMTRRFLNK